MKASFLNVDVVILSKVRLDALEAELGNKVTVLYSGPHRKKHMLSLERARVYKSPDTAIHSFCSLIEGLSSEARQLWNRAQKTFDLGYELPTAELSSQFTLRNDTLMRMANLGATLTVAFYQGERHE
jgi:hypothetical protein